MRGMFVPFPVPNMVRGKAKEKGARNPRPQRRIYGIIRGILVFGASGMRRAVFAIALLFAAPAVLFAAPASAAPAPARTAGGLPVSKRTLSEKNPVVEIEANYPQTGNPKIDADLVGTIRSIAT